MKHYITFVATLITLTSLSAQESRNEALHLLQETIAKSDSYIQAKENKINHLKQTLLKNTAAAQQYLLNQQLYEEYRKFKVDSAIAYLLKNEKIATQLQEKQLKDETHIQLSKLYSVKGMYVEALQLLKNIDKEQLTNEELCKYYDSYYSLCSRYGQSISNSDYLKASNSYRDSLLMCSDKQSFTYKLNSAIDAFFTGDKTEAEKAFSKLLPKTTEKEPKRAVIAYYLGLIHQEKGNINQQEYYFALSAITDIKNAIKDNASLQGLALTTKKEILKKPISSLKWLLMMPLFVM